MKIECVKNKIYEAVSKAEKITGKNLTLPILSSILVETKNSSIIIKATNLDLGVEIEVPAKIIEKGEFAVSGATLSHFLGNLMGDDKIIMETGGTDLNVSTNITSTRIKIQNHEDFPIIPKVSGGKVVTVDSKDFVHGIRSVYYAAAVSGMKPELSSVYIYSDGEENLVFVSTDSFRLAEKKIHVRKGKDLGSVLIPFKNIGEILRILESVNGEVEVSISPNQISFQADGVYLVSRVIDGTFPDYKQIIPKDFKTEATLLKQDFISSLKLANVFSDSFNQLIFKVSPDKKIFEITTKNNDVGENKTALDAVLSGEELTISFNHKYIFDCFQSIPSDSISLSFTGLGRPVCVRGVSDRSFLYIVMPMNR